MFRYITASLLFLFTLAAHGASDFCSQCGARLPQRYLQLEQRAFCSDACLDKQLPQCSVCDKVLRGTYQTVENQNYCSSACFRSTLPICKLCSEPVEEGFVINQHHYCGPCKESAPTCFSCGLPAKRPTHLPDGRAICMFCMRWAVTSPTVAQRHYDLARRQLEAWTSLKIESVPALHLVDRTEMEALSNQIRKSDSPVSVRGLYSRQTVLRRRGLLGGWKPAPELDEEKIYIVGHLHDEVFRTAATHELMHDLIYEHFPQLRDAPLWVHEGICQRAAAEYCRRRNYSDILYGIEECPDPDYGDGYRYFRSITGYEGWPALQRWIEAVDVATLPETGPVE